MNMELDEITLIGLSLGIKTTNAGGQSGLACGNLWQEFEKRNIAEKITGKLSDSVLAVYHGYDGGSEKPFSYFIGCKVKADAPVPEGMDKLVIPKGKYQKLTAKGKMPSCVSYIWKGIWDSDIPRSYITDFEVYDERSKDWSNAEVDIFLSVNE